ncbi:MAG: sporulation protein [Cyclobacteriaceae bacterium]
MGVLKSVKNFLTGGAAEVKIEIKNHEIREDEPLQLVISVTAKEETIFIKELYLKIKAEERSANTNNLHSAQKSIERDIQINGGETKQWETSIEIPLSAPSTFLGRHSSLLWYALAGLDMSGVDPSSGWEKFIVDRPVSYA